MTITSAKRTPLSLLLALFLAVGVAAGFVLVAAPQAQAAPVTETIDGITYTADDANLAAGATITAYDATGPMGLDPVIPATVSLGGTNFDVTSATGTSFANKGLTSVVIPPSLTTFGNGAFANNSLTSLALPATVTTIGPNAFQGNQFTSLTLPSSLTTIGAGAFGFNHLLTSVTIPSSVTSIGSAAFGETTALTTVYFDGDAPAIVAAPSSFGPAAGKTLYFNSTATGFTSPTWQGYTTGVMGALTITSGSFPLAGTTSFYSFPVTAAGTPAPTLSVAGLPPGLSFNSATGVISGTPTAIGTYPVTITASNGVSPAAVLTQFLEVVQGITFGPPPGNGVVGTPYSHSMTATGLGTLTWSINPLYAALPDGLTMDSAGNISGTPTTAGTSVVQFVVSNGGLQPNRSTNVSMTIDPAPAATHTVSFDSNGGSAVADQVVADGGTATAPAAPTRAGFTFTGWFADAGLTTPFDFAVLVTGDVTLYAGWTAGVPAAPTITSGPFPVAGESTPYSYDIIATGVPTPTLTVTGLPPGLTFNSAMGRITGTPTTLGTFSVTITASNGVGPDAVLTQDLEVRAGIITGPPPGNGAVGVSYSHTMTATALGTVTWTVDAGYPLPPGLTMDTAGTISGAPTTQGSYVVRFWASNGGLQADAFINATIVIDPAPAVTHTVSFDSGGGSAVADQVVADGATATAPAAPTRAGFTFTGWFTDVTLATAFSFATPVTGDVTVFAGWTAASTVPGPGSGSVPAPPSPTPAPDGQEGLSNDAVDSTELLAETGGSASLAALLFGALAVIGGIVLRVLGRRQVAADGAR